MRLRLDDIAQKMLQSGYTSRDVDTDKFVNRIVEILDIDNDLFSLVADEMQIIEEEYNE